MCVVASASQTSQYAGQRQADATMAILAASFRSMRVAVHNAKLWQFSADSADRACGTSSVSLVWTVWNGAVRNGRAALASSQKRLIRQKLRTVLFHWFAATKFTLCINHRKSAAVISTVRWQVKLWRSRTIATVCRTRKILASTERRLRRLLRKVLDLWIQEERVHLFLRSALANFQGDTRVRQIKASVLWWHRKAVNRNNLRFKLELFEYGLYQASGRRFLRLWRSAQGVQARLRRVWVYKSAERNRQISAVFPVTPVQARFSHALRLFSMERIRFAATPVGLNGLGSPDDLAAAERAQASIVGQVEKCASGLVAESCFQLWKKWYSTRSRAHVLRHSVEKRYSRHFLRDWGCRTVSHKVCRSRLLKLTHRMRQSCGREYFNAWASYHCKLADRCVLAAALKARTHHHWLLQHLLEWSSVIWYLPCERVAAYHIRYLCVKFFLAWSRVNAHGRSSRSATWRRRLVRLQSPRSRSDNGAPRAISRYITMQGVPGSPTEFFYNS